MEKNYLGFDLDEELMSEGLTDEDIAILLDGMKPSEITVKIDDEELNKISDFYNGKCICLTFDEFGCKTFGKCHGVKIVDGKFVFLFKHVVDVYKYYLECNEAEDGEFVEVEAPYDVYTYFYVSEMGDGITFDDMNVVKDVLEGMLIGNVREYFWWMQDIYTEDYKTNPNRYDKIDILYRLKDENDDIVKDVVRRCVEDGDIEYKLFGAEKYERIDISKNELKDICDFYKGRFVIMLINGQPHFGRISHMDIKANTHKVKLFFDTLLVNDDGLWVKAVDKNSLKFELGTDFNNDFFNKNVCSSDDIINLMCHYLMQLHHNEMCMRHIGEEFGMSFENDKLYEAAFKK